MSPQRDGCHVRVAFTCRAPRPTGVASPPITASSDRTVDGLSGAGDNDRVPNCRRQHRRHALYRDGRRVASPPTVTDAHRSLLAEQGTMAWIGLYRPSEAQLLAAARRSGCM